MLVRGRNSIKGEVVWSSELRFGVRLARRVVVSDWMTRPANPEQVRVVHILSAVSAGAVPLIVPEQQSGMSYQVADELRRVSRLIDNVGDFLAQDAEIVERYGRDLQCLDVATQMIKAIGELVQAEISLPTSKLRGLRH
jgi:hypothetical protein